MARGAMRFLLPHERWLVGPILGSQRKRRTTAVVAMERKYGPDGMIWLDASLANVRLASSSPYSVLSQYSLIRPEPAELRSTCWLPWPCSGSCTLSGFFRLRARAGSFAGSINDPSWSASAARQRVIMLDVGNANQDSHGGG